MLNSILITFFLLFFSISSQSEKYPIQTYIYDDDNFIIKVKTNLYGHISTPLPIYLEFESKKDNIFILKDINQTDNFNSNILIIEYGGMFESSLDQPIEMIHLNQGEKWVITKDFDISKYSEKTLLKTSLSIGYIISKQKILDNKYLSQIEFSEGKNTTSLSSIIIDASLDRMDLGLFSIKLIH